MNLSLFQSTISLFQQTPLHIAASKGRDYTVKFLLDKGAHVNFKDKNGVGETILRLNACWRSCTIYFQEVRFVVFNSLVLHTYSFGQAQLILIHFVFFFHQRTPLYLAAESGRIKKMDYLFSQEADVNNQDENGVAINTYK